MEHNHRHESQQVAQILILWSYFAMALGLIAETILMSWELWAIPLIAAAVFACWMIHIRQRIPSGQRIWIYTFLMMATFFYYGIHLTSTFDMALLMLVVMIIYTVAGESRLVTFCQVTYYVTLAYDLIAMVRDGSEWNSLLISRIALHAALMFLAGWLARRIIRQWEQMFRESEEQIDTLEKTAERMHEFMANLSHELRTPVNLIHGTTGILMEKNRDPELGKSLASIREAGERMAFQVSDIMDYSEIETGHLVVNREQCALASLLHDLVSELSPGLSDRLELVIDVDADTPAEVVTDPVKLRRILFHVIGNGLQYTKEGGVYVHISSIPQSYGINLCIEVSDTGIGMDEKEAEQAVRRFYQAESGKQIRTGGLGLGLPIVSGFVRALGGFLRIESRAGKGTTVSISVPMEVADAGACMSVAGRDGIHLGGYLNIGKFQHPYVREFYNRMILNIVKGLGTPMHRVGTVEELRKLNGEIPLTHLFTGLEEYLSAPDYLEELARRMIVVVVSKSADQIPAGSAVNWMPKPLYGFPIAEVLNAGGKNALPGERKFRCPDVRALIVDDEPMNLTVAAGILKRYGMQVSTAGSGAEALHMCMESVFDLVFMDHMMPEMDGVEAMHRLRRLFEEKHISCPVIALTANALSSAREKFLREGFDGFVSKPIEILQLERILRRVLPEEKLVSGEMQSREMQSCEMQSGEIQSCGGGADFTKQLELEGFAVGQALGYCQEDRTLYRSLLRQFEEEAEKKQTAMRRFCDQADDRNLMILVHAVKGTAKMIGALAFSEQARRMEEALKNGETGYAKEHLEDFLAGYRKAAENIRNSLGKQQKEDDTAEDAADGTLEFYPEESAGDGYAESVSGETDAVEREWVT